MGDSDSSFGVRRGPVLALSMDGCDAELEPMVLENMKHYGISSVSLRAGNAISPWLNVLFIPKALVPKSSLNSSNTCYVGPSEPLGKRGDEVEFPWERLSGDVPKIYVSSGGGHSLCFEPETVKTICDSLSPTDALRFCGR